MLNYDTQSFLYTHNLSISLLVSPIISLNPVFTYSVHSATLLLLAMHKLALFEKNNILNSKGFMISSTFLFFSKKHYANRLAFLSFFEKQLSSNDSIFAEIRFQMPFISSPTAPMAPSMTSLTLGSINQYQQWLIIPYSSLYVYYMTRLPQLLLFKIITLIHQISLGIEILIAEIIKYIYIPFTFTSSLDKISQSISNLNKLPDNQVTFVVQVCKYKKNEFKKTAQQIARFAKIIEQGCHPINFNCWLNFTNTRPSQQQEFHQLLSNSLKSCSLKLYDKDKCEKLSIQKSTTTPLVMVFSTYPSIGGTWAGLLIGAEIAFNPVITKCTDFDIFSSLQRYATSQQRKGK